MQERLERARAITPAYVGSETYTKVQYDATGLGPLKPCSQQPGSRKDRGFGVETSFGRLLVNASIGIAALGSTDVHR